MINDPKKFKIPSSFTLLGHRYTVEMSDELYEKDGAFGLFLDDTKNIKLQTPTMVTREDTVCGKKKINKFVISNETVIESYYHELTHAILEAIGEDKLSENEKLVNLFGKAMLEIYRTSNYEK